MVRIGQKVADRADVKISRAAVGHMKFAHQWREQRTVGRGGGVALQQRTTHDGDGLLPRTRVQSVSIQISDFDAQSGTTRPCGAFDRRRLRGGPGIHVATRELRVRGLAVIALHVVLDGELPIGADLEAFAVRHLGLRPAVSARRLGERTRGVIQGRRLRGKAYEDQSFQDPDRE